MPKRFLSPAQAVLLILLASLLLAWLLSGRAGRKQEPRGAGAAAVFDPSLVQEISFERGGAKARVVRETDGFWIVEPYRDRADPKVVAQSLKVAAGLAPLRELPDTISAPYGLAAPSAAWRCAWPGGSYEIALGDSLPAGAGRFARRTGSSAIVVLDPFLARRFLVPPIRELHDPSAASLDVGPIDSLRVDTREERIAIIRRRSDLWEIVRPIHGEAEAAVVSRAVESLRAEGLTGFLGPTSASDLRALGLDPPRATWTLFQGGKGRAVRIGHPTPDQKSVAVIPAQRDVVALIDSENFRAWVDGLSRLRESLLLSTPADSVTEVELKGPGGSRLFTRGGGGRWFERAGPESLAVRSDAFDSALRNLCGLRAVGYRSAPGTRIAEPFLRLRLLRASGRADTVDVSPPRGETAEAKGPRVAGVCLVPASVHRTWELWLRRPLRP